MRLRFTTHNRPYSSLFIITSANECWMSSVINILHHFPRIQLVSWITGWVLLELQYRSDICLASRSYVAMLRNPSLIWDWLSLGYTGVVFISLSLSLSFSRVDFYVSMLSDLRVSLCIFCFFCFVFFISISLRCNDSVIAVLLDLMNGPVIRFPARTVTKRASIFLFRRDKLMLVIYDASNCCVRCKDRIKQRRY